MNKHPDKKINNSTPKPEVINYWYRAQVGCIVGLLLFCALFGLPVVGNLVMSKVYDLIGCSFGFTNQPPCILMGHDIGPRFAGYGVVILGMVLTPYLFVLAFWELLIAWVVLIVFLIFKAETWRADS